MYLAAANALLATAALAVPTSMEATATLKARADAVDPETQAMLTMLAWYAEAALQKSYICISPNWEINLLYVDSMKSFGGSKCSKQAWRWRTQENGVKVPDGAVWVCHNCGSFSYFQVAQYSEKMYYSCPKDKTCEIPGGGL